MKRRSDNPEDFDSLREKIIGLGERSIRKSYYPKLREQLQELERFRTLLDQSNDAIFLMTVPSGSFIDVNEAACRMLSYSRNQLLTLSLDRVADTSTLERLHELLKRREAGEECCLVQEIIFVKSSGDQFPVEISARLVGFGGALYAVAAARDITERKRAEEQLKQLSHRHQLILESAGEGIFGLDVHGNYTFMNKSAAAMLGYEAEELIGRHSHSCIHHTKPDGTPYAEEECKTYAAFRNGATRYVDDECFCRKDGTMFPVEYTGTPIQEGNKIIGAVITFSDITERKRGEEALRTSEANYRQIFNSVNDAIIVHDINTGEVLSANRKTEEMFGYSTEEFPHFISETLFSGAPGYTADDALLLIRRATEGQPQLFEWMSRRKNGELFWVEVNLKRAVIGGEQRVLAIVRDITERKHAENRLRETESNLRTVLDNVYDAVFIHNLDGTIIDVNRKMLELYGVDREQALRSTIIGDFSAPENPFEKVPDIWNKAIAGEDQFFEWKAQRPYDGSVFDVEVFLHKITFAAKEVILASVRDITERKKADEMKSRLSAIVETADDAILSENPDGVVRTWNKGAEKIYGYSAEEIVGKSLSLLIPPDRSNEFSEILEKISRGEHIEHYETERIRKDGSRFHVSISVSPMKAPDGGITGATIIAHDITDRIQAQQARTLTQFSIDHASVSAFLVDKDARLLYVNEQTCRTLGYAREELLTMAMYDLDPYFPKAGWSRHWHQLKKEGSLRFETQHRRKDGSLVPVEVSANFVAFGGREYNWGFAQDISERKRAENALRQAYKLLKTILDSMNDAISLIDVRNFTIVGANNVFLRDYGYSEESEVVGKHCYEITHRRPDVCSPPDDICPLIESVKTKEHFTADHVHYDKEGGKIYVEVSTSPIKDDAGNVIQVVHVQRNITERKLAEEALRISESRFRSLFKQSSVSMQILSPDGRTLEVNHAFEALWSLNPDVLKDYNILTDAQLVEKGIMPYIQKGFAGEASEIPISQYDSSDLNHAGRTRWVKAFIYPVKTSDGRVHQVVLMHWDVTEMVQAQEALKESENRFRAFFESAGVGTVQLDPSTRKFARVNQRFCEITGYSSDELKTLTISDLTHPDDRITDAEKFAALLRPGGPMYESEKRYIRKDGRIVWVQVSATIVRDARGRPIHTAGIIQDITSRKHAEAALRGSEEFLRRILDNLIAFVAVLTSDGVVLEVNRSALSVAGLDLDDVLGKRFDKTYWFSWSQEVQSRIREAMQRAAQGEYSRFDTEVIVEKGRFMPVDFMLAPISDESGRITHLIPSAIDITGRKKMEDEIRHMAHHDTLTGLPNRRLFQDIAGVELAQAERNRKKLAMLFLDLDRFKEINDTLGHQAGDLLLKEVASRLKFLLRKSDSLGRIGGDEFNILLADINRPEDASDIARKIVSSFRKYFVIAGQELHVTTSIGISIYPDDGRELEGLLRYADMAMYQAKEKGGNSYQFYDPSINIRSIERMKLENMLRRSLELGELVVYYQPQMDIASGKIKCAEALLRWRHPERGLLLAKEFIAAAEETGFIAEIDEWVLREVSKQVKAWDKAGLPPVCITVNLSARQFQNPELLLKITGILKEAGIAPEWLDIEIPESMAMKDVERSAALMRKLADMGVHISIDDFGTGYSSLNYLKRMPIEKLKIDQSFIKDIASDRDDREIIHAVTAMAHNMRMKVIAEGVETEEQLAFLRATGCDEMQGFLISGAVPPREFEKLLIASGK